MALPAWSTGSDDTWPEVAELSPWDTLVLNGKKLPGVARIHAERGRKHDRAAPPGVDGESFHDLGAAAAQLEILITVWSSEQLEELAQVLDDLMPAPKKMAPPTEPVPKILSYYLSYGDNLKSEANPLPASQAQPTIYALQVAEPLKPLTIAHPSLRRLRVRSILIVKEENFKPGPKVGTFEWRCRAVEWMGKGKATAVSTPKGSGGDQLDLSSTKVAPTLVPPSKNPKDTGP